MVKINLKGVRNHSLCPKRRAHTHRCYRRDIAEALAEARNDESVFEVYVAFACKDNRCKKYGCWHVGHVMEYTPPQAAIDQYESELVNAREERNGGVLIQYGRLQVAWRPK